METRAHHLIIGIFTLLIVAAAFLFVLWAGKLQIDREYAYYDITFAEAVTGLTDGALVRYQGVPVGDVARIWIDPARPSEVQVTIRITVAPEDVRVLDTTRASLEPEGLTGASFIQLTNQSMEGRPLPLDYVFGGDHPQIPSQRSTLASLFADAPRLLGTADDLLNDLRALLTPETRANIAGIIADINVLTTTLAERQDTIDAMIVNLETVTGDAAGLTGDLKVLSADLRSLAQGLETSINDNLPGILAQVGGAAESIDALAMDASRVVRDNEEAVATFSNQGLAQLGLFVTEARQLVASLDRLAQRLESDPSALIFGGSRPAEIEPRR